MPQKRRGKQAPQLMFGFSPKQQKGFLAAFSAGDLGAWLDVHGGARKLFEKAYLNPRTRERAMSYISPAGLPGMGTGASHAPMTTPRDIANLSPMGNLASLMGNYAAPLPDLATAYMQNLAKGGIVDQPSFQEMFGTWRDVAQRETDRQSAAIKEQFGSMGGTYGSDALNAQSRLRESFGQDIAAQAAQYQKQLRDQQYGEVAGLSNMAYGANEAAMQRMFQDFLRRTSPPPLLSALQQAGLSYGLPATAIY